MIDVLLVVLVLMFCVAMAQQHWIFWLLLGVLLTMLIFCLSFTATPTIWRYLSWGSDEKGQR